MNTVSNYQPRPQAIRRNNVQRCQSCKEERDNLQQKVWLAYSSATCIGCSMCGLVCGCSNTETLLTGLACTGCCQSLCWNIAGAGIDKCLKERKCCHFDNLPYQPDAGESDGSGASDSETDAREKLIADIFPPAQFRLITVQPDSNSVRNRAAQGCLTSPHHSVMEDNGDSNGADAVKNTTDDFVAVDIIEDFLSGCGTQTRKKVK
ncbi:hypothetical protein [Endozoicomonas sp. YOMI1]|uniref:hypothetical protein n=1 Tax=Endozoicomonas sp. YOMI1 TaxID=2828739 RepID=UPI002148F2C4|nr:hypothetical protein [Endozoicomonas sp. YOMI1]